MMNFADRYISKQNKIHFFEAPILAEIFQLVVVIPCYNEPDLKLTLQSLFECKKPDVNAAIVVVINDSEQSNLEEIKQNQLTCAEIDEFKTQSPNWLSLHYIYATNLPNKHAGVGWARKIGMDWAITHFNRYKNKKGIIVSLDADSQVELNYFTSIVSYYQQKPDSIGTILHFEHPIPPGIHGEAITLYELYMRYYKHALEYIGFPYPIYSLGSCFTVRAYAYVQQGGMNRKKAGEDFYFLQKLLFFGSIGQIKNTTVKPSSRISTRVPFGTGPILKQYLEGEKEIKKTYPLDAFLLLKPFFDKVDSYYHNDQLTIDNFSNNIDFKSFLNEINFITELKELISNCSSLEVYRKRFYHLFNAFKILKWLNFGIINGFQKRDLIEESERLLNKMNIKTLVIENDANKMLNLFRYLDKTT